MGKHVEKGDRLPNGRYHGIQTQSHHQLPEMQFDDSAPSHLRYPWRFYEEEPVQLPPSAKATESSIRDYLEEALADA